MELAQTGYHEALHYNIQYNTERAEFSITTLSDDMIIMALKSKSPLGELDKKEFPKKWEAGKYMLVKGKSFRLEYDGERLTHKIEIPHSDLLLIILRDKNKIPTWVKNIQARYEDLRRKV